ncbi:MAG: SDR family NAD(P)-dependent oxidoreductase, partial [Chitinophagaceae bacterium]
MSLENKVAYITGGTKGIGFGIAKALVNAGVKVAISGRKLADVEKAKADLGGTNVLAIQSDVRNFEDEEKAVAQIVAEFGKLDIIIANA